MSSRRRATVLVLLCLAAVIATSACAGVLKKKYEYEEEIYLLLDGSATVNVNASVASLVALRGMDLSVDPTARIDRRRVRALFEGAGATVTRVSFSRRNGRRFVHVGIDVADVRQLSRLAPFSWSAYQFVRQGDVFVYKQTVGKPAGKFVGDVGWKGSEAVMFKLHLPSQIPYHNAPSRRVERGNILEWEQPLAERLQGVPVNVDVRMDTSSILYSTLLLFGSTIVAAALTFGVVVWLVWRRGRESEGVS
ncbi:MAG TPA: hypothetical protein VKB50_21010 [Vicinamibacterales bacterium]|nr:hypothetical protein [Vicinamibacterales bacterium]